MRPERTGSGRWWSAGWDGREFWTSRPAYVELYGDARRTVIIQGVLRHDGAPLSAAQVLASLALDLEPEQVMGNGTIVVIDRPGRRLWAYRTMLGTAEVYWWSDKGRLLCTDNLGAMAALLPEPRLCEQALPLHFIYRSVPGHLTYLRDVHRLGPGELLTWQDGSGEVRLRRDLRTLAPERQVGIEPSSISNFSATLASTIAEYERAAARRGTGVAILLSGGLDSSLMVLAAGAGGRKPVALTTITQRTAELEREIVYARQAAERLQAEHRFVEAGRMDYAEALIETIKVLGQPPHHESTVNGLVSSRELARQEPGLGLLLHGQGADALHGLNVAAAIQYAERCPAWSLPVLRLAANMLGHVAPTKVPGAHAAAAMLSALRTPESPLHPANAQAAYTDWAAMEQAFGCQALREAMGYRREWAARYADAETVTEQVQMIDLLSDAWDTACLTRQVGLAHGREIAFPFLDEAVVSASLAFNPRVRFAAGRRTKPVLKAALAAGTSRAFADRPKLSGGFPSALFEEMRSGSLADLVHSIQRPGFVSRELFEQKKERPDWFTWNLLTFDLWEKLVLRARETSQSPTAISGSMSMRDDKDKDA
jgi:asparagine synthetase B (glutamine-hydrolysing)